MARRLLETRFPINLWLMEFIKNLLTKNKTYKLAAIAGILVAIQTMGWWQVPAELWAALGIGGAATLRAGIGKK